MTDSSSLLSLADQCVKCGLCLPQCPTYTLSLNENESPRGRISLVQALASGQLETNEKLITHIDHCLQCRRCERVCPSQVKYGEILSAAYQQISGLRQTNTWLTKTGLFLLQTTKRLQLFKTLLRFYQSSGLQFIARTSGVLKLFKLTTVEQRLPKIYQDKIKSPDKSQRLKSVALFTGCSQTIFDSAVINSTIRLLNALDIDVVIPRQQSCCGALHQLQGEEAASLIKNNIEVFEKNNIDTVLFLSTGCGAFIKEQYDSSNSFIEATDYLKKTLVNQLAFKPLTKTVAVHMPCSQKNILQQQDTTSTLLSNIPGIQLVSLEQHGCCGAGGTTMLKYPGMADEIRQPLLNKVIQTNCDVMVTTNPGCQLHMQHGFNSQKSPVKVIHPVTLLAQQLAD